jgi:pyruvate formate lyase activating enzyme
MEIGKTSGIVFNIQHYSIHDGPGIRTTVFLKGCPLKCLWCQNPESQTPTPEILLNSEKCIGCGHCVSSCPEEAVSMNNEKAATDRKKCRGCGTCAQLCPSKARTLMGCQMTASEVFEDVNKDAMFYESSNGGVTISGGEPIFQTDFCSGILKLCQDAGIHTAIETCGFGKWKLLKDILNHTKLVLYDLKQMDTNAHKVCTGVPNDLILENAKKIYHMMKLLMVIRVPVVPGYNDSFENMELLGFFVAKELGSLVVESLRRT